MTPLSNARAKLIRSLHRRKGRDAEGAYIAEGERLISELVERQASVRFLFCESDRLDWVKQHFPNADVSLIERAESGLFATENAQGIGAVIEKPSPPSLSELVLRDLPLLMLDAIADPGNCGAIIRTAEWFGLGGVLLGAGSVDLYNPKTVRATMGAIFRLPLIEDVSLNDVLALKLPVLALDANAETVLGEVELPRRAIYVIGSEAHGVSSEVLAVARAVAIRGAGQGESLNASVASAILCYELSRSLRLSRQSP